MDDNSLASLGLIPLVLIVAMVIFEVVAQWKVFEKAGQPGWAALIPVYNLYIFLKIAGKPGWWVLLFFIPLVNFVILIIVMLQVATAFGKGAGFGMGLALLAWLFIPILAFGDATYQESPAV